MKLIIDIPDEDYKGICHLKNEQLRTLPDEVAETLIRIANGTPLPKGHGRLIDADELKRIIQGHDVLYMTGFNVRLCDINNTPTIIEADKAESEE